MDPFFLICCIISAFSFSIMEYTAHGVKPMWAQSLLGSSASVPVWQESLPALHAGDLPVTVTSTATVTVVPSGYMPPHSLSTLPPVAPSWSHSSITEMVLDFAALIYTLVSSLVSALVSTLDSVPLFSAPYILGLAVALGIAALSSLATRRWILSQSASDAQLACLEAKIQQQNAAHDEERQHHSGALRDLRRRHKAQEKVSAEAQRKTADRSAADMLSKDEEIARLRSELDQANHKILLASYEPENKHGAAVANLEAQIKRLNDNLDKAETDLATAQREIEAKAEGMVVGEMESKTKEIDSLQQELSNLNTQLEAEKQSARNEAWDAKEKARRASTALKDEVKDLKACLAAKGEKHKVESADKSKQLEEMRHTILGLRAELAAAKIQADLRDLPTFTCDPAGSKEAALRDRLQNVLRNSSVGSESPSGASAASGPTPGPSSGSAPASSSDAAPAPTPEAPVTAAPPPRRRPRPQASLFINKSQPTPRRRGGNQGSS